MLFALTNDDGIDAPGIAALEQAVQLASEQAASIPKLAAIAKAKTLICAPLLPHSGCSHQLTTGSSIMAEPKGKDRYAIHGTPGDCTRLAIANLAPQANWILAGINAGGNLGVDVYYSGTVAAAREAAINGYCAISISHWIRRPLKLDWEVAARWTGKILLELLAKDLPPKHFWNVNIPHLPPESPEPEIVYCSVDTEPLLLEFKQSEKTHFQYAGSYSDRPRQPGTDVDVCFNGQISVSLISV
ncbi:MAG: 5'/3'-nucleotidase SurE [Cyanobacteria bacterium P01_H01_bin.15]